MNQSNLFSDAISGAKMIMADYPILGTILTFLAIIVIVGCSFNVMVVVGSTIRGIFKK